jgi:hypothetical protein
MSRLSLFIDLLLDHVVTQAHQGDPGGRLVCRAFHGDVVQV